MYIEAQFIVISSWKLPHVHSRKEREIVVYLHNGILSMEKEDIKLCSTEWKENPHEYNIEQKKTDKKNAYNTI